MKVFFLVLVDVYNFELFEFSAAILEKGLLTSVFHASVLLIITNFVIILSK